MEKNFDLIDPKIKDEILNIFDDLYEKKERGIIAIDGRCGAGKSTLGEFIQSVRKCSLIHMDHFYLRKEQRSEERLSEAGGNIDRERFIEEVLEPLKKGESFTYGELDCRDFTIDKRHQVENDGITIIEGSYSLHPAFGDYYDYGIFLTVDEDEQVKRIEKRNKDKVDLFINRWIPMEEKYFKNLKIEERAMLTIKNQI